MHTKTLQKQPSLLTGLLAKLLLLSIGWYFFITPVIAKERPLHLKDAGAISCSDALKIYEAVGNEVEKTAILHWLSGYSIGKSESRELIDVFPIVDTNEFVQMVLLVCTEQTNVRLKSAAEETIHRLQPLWVSGSVETVVIEDGKENSVLFAQSIIPLQNLLRQNVDPRLPPDGFYRNRTKKAMTTLLSEAGLPAKTRPTGAALYLLTRPQPEEAAEKQ